MNVVSEKQETGVLAMVGEKNSFKSKVRKNRVLLLMLLPACTLMFVFAYLPMGGLVLAFKEFRYDLGILGSEFVGLTNFKFFFQSGDAMKVTVNTAFYNGAFIVVNTVLQVGFAVILSEMGGKRMKKALQSVIFLPYFISWVIVGSIAYSLFNFENGTVNALLQRFGMEAVNIYGKPSWWRGIIIGFSAWKGVGYGMVVFLASIAGIDASLNEAAQIDGANIFQRIRYITIPCIQPTIITMTLLAIGKIFKGNLDLFYQLVGNNGALFDATDVIDTYVFRSLLQSGDVGRTAAVGLYQSILCFVTVVAANYIVKRRDPDYALF